MGDVMSLQYLQSTFLTFDQLSELTGVEPARLRGLIKAGCLPGPAYRVVGECVISSIFGDHADAVELQFFPRSYVAKVNGLVQSGLPDDELARREKQDFFAQYVETLVALRVHTFGLDALYGQDGHVGGAEAEALLEKEWLAYLDGAYGLCTGSASAEEIATKEAMIAKIKFLIAAIETGGAGTLLAELEQAVDLLDQVSAPFAPHEVARSSRETYINQVRARYLAQVA
jgi:hypothetical protein